MKVDPRDCTCLKLRAASRRLTQRYDHALAPSGLRIGQFSILSFVSMCANPGVTQVADYFDMDISTATRNLRPLLADGYLEMKTGKRDARRRELKLTAKGARTLEKALALWIDVQRRVVKELGAPTNTKLHAMLDKVR